MYGDHSKASWIDLDKIRAELKEKGVKLPVLRSHNLKADDRMRSQVRSEPTEQGREQPKGYRSKAHQRASRQRANNLPLTDKTDRNEQSN